MLRTRPDDVGFEADFADLWLGLPRKAGAVFRRNCPPIWRLKLCSTKLSSRPACRRVRPERRSLCSADGELVCRASSGLTAPELGVTSRFRSRPSGECIRTRLTQRCDDVLADLRVDVVAQRLGCVRLWSCPFSGDGLVGVFELFSFAPHAFGERDELTLEALAGRILSNLERTTQPLPAQSENLSISEQLPDGEPRTAGKCSGAPIRLGNVGFRRSRLPVVWCYSVSWWPYTL